MKRTIYALAAALTLMSATAHAQQFQDVQTTFPDGYTALSPADLAPIPGAKSAFEMEQYFPQPSFDDQTHLSQEDLQPRAGAESAAEIIAGFPQPSFQDYPHDLPASSDAAVAESAPVVNYSAGSNY